jgi:Na+/pantothenate symporter
LGLREKKGCAKKGCSASFLENYLIMRLQVALLLCFVGNASAFLASNFLHGYAAGFKSGLEFVRIDPRKAFDKET